MSEIRYLVTEEYASGHCRELMEGVGLDPDNTPTGIFS